jgi:hypothetical protein
MRRTVELPEMINVRVTRDMRKALATEAARSNADISDVVRGAIAAAITGNDARDSARRDGQSS